MSETVSFSSGPTPDDSETAEEVARDQQYDDTAVHAPSDALDPTGALPEQMAAKEASNALGDQDAVNLAGPALPAGVEIPNASNVRRYPHLFSQEVIDSFNTDDDLTDDQREEHNVAVEDHWRSRGVEPAEETVE